MIPVPESLSSGEDPYPRNSLPSSPHLPHTPAFEGAQKLVLVGNVGKKKTAQNTFIMAQNVSLICNSISCKNAFQHIILSCPQSPPPFPSVHLCHILWRRWLFGNIRNWGAQNEWEGGGEKREHIYMQIGGGKNPIQTDWDWHIWPQGIILLIKSQKVRESGEGRGR